MAVRRVPEGGRCEPRQPNSFQPDSALGTYYCAEAAARDFYRLGSAIADFLERPTLGDAFSIVLRSAREERMRFLAAKGIDAQRIRAMRELLGRPEEDDDADEIIVSVPSKPAGRQEGGTAGAGQGQREGRNGEHTSGERRDSETAQRLERPPLPPLDLTRLTVVDAGEGTLRQHERDRQKHNRGGSGTGGSRHPNWAELESTRRLYGRRGEEAAYEAERNRLRAAGLDPDYVHWVSRDEEQSDHDLESLDEGGETIYIEVKSTPSTDPGEPFPITSAEMRFAARHRSNYFIYRVTRIHEAVPAITRYRDPIGLWEEGKADTEATQARMWLPQHGADDEHTPT